MLYSLLTATCFNHNFFFSGVHNLTGFPQKFDWDLERELSMVNRQHLDWIWRGDLAIPLGQLLNVKE
ncbi:hypothetical protein H1P_980005 [Hyella patelloides LEGE 07179]|uniref:Uncharacterized protein n=1 Tax=Hyella patelloides LEGE 07179 TaxID=945734 RepID=A0A563W5M6_9CYAN|nr:hypothetical protein H1P_980005 [Hyella patelloides LEGE 07179]